YSFISSCVIGASTPVSSSIIFEAFFANVNIRREYNLKYLGRIGNVFHTKDIEAAIEKGRKYDPDVIGSPYFSSRSMGIDPA
ncbi:MAG: hypothetical protein ACJ71X_10120, partial [Nitrososphaeraceae archaeon]